MTSRFNNEYTNIIRFWNNFVEKLFNAEITTSRPFYGLVYFANKCRYLDLYNPANDQA